MGVVPDVIVRVCAFKSNLFTILRTSLNDVDVKLHMVSFVFLLNLASSSSPSPSSSSISCIELRISSRLFDFKSHVSPKHVIILAAAGFRGESCGGVGSGGDDGGGGDWGGRGLGERSCCCFVYLFDEAL